MHGFLILIMNEEILDNLTATSTGVDGEIQIENIHALNTGMFIFISIVTFGLYPVWWQYKTWRFFKHEKKLDILPFWRTFFFNIIFFLPLCIRIKELAQ